VKKIINMMFFLVALLTTNIVASEKAQQHIESLSEQKNIEMFLKKTFRKSPVSLLGFSVLAKNKVPSTKWTEYLTVIKVKPNKVNKEGSFTGDDLEPIEVAQILFSDGFFITGDIYDPNEDKFLSEIYKPIPGAETAIERRLIYGDINSSNQILIYADPLCKFCREEIPTLLKLMRDEKVNNFSVFLVNLPLKRIHPASTTLVKIITLELLRNNPDIVYDIYRLKINSKLHEEKVIVDIVNKQLNKKYTIEELNNKKVLDTIEEDRKNATSFMVNSTPSIFLNGVLTKDIIGKIEESLF